MDTLEPILIADLLPVLDQKLLELLKSLSIEDWDRPTIVPSWTVKNIASHLLDGNLRSLSMLRDGYFGESPERTTTYQDLLTFLNRLNADWVLAMQRLSPNILVELLESTGKQYSRYIQSLDPYDKATFSVAWAGEEESFNWFHIAREYTEKWHHQQQIRLSVGQVGPLYQPRLYLPYLETSMRALPYHYQGIKGDEGHAIQFTISEPITRSWNLLRMNESWKLSKEIDMPITTQVIIPYDIAWRVFTKGIDRKLALQQSNILGSRDQGEHFFKLLAIMA